LGAKDHDEAKYVRIDLGTVVGNQSTSFGINNRGDVVGESVDSVNGIVHAFLWRNGTMHDLGTLGGDVSHANAINDRGQVVGWASLNPSLRHAILWDRGVKIDLHPAGAIGNSAALGINEEGDIVGWFSLSDYIERACVWKRGVMIDLKLRSDPRSNAIAINDRGDIVGYYGTGTLIPFLFRKGSLVSLEFPGSYANDVNQRGDVTVVGGLLYRNKKGIPIPLSPVGINDDGAIAGACSNPIQGYWPCVWKDGSLTPRGMFGLDGFFAAINNEGDIAGTAIVNGRNRATLWRRR
jgi:probable HAF family extracellular repeat protein